MLYENVFEKDFKLYARLFDEKTKKSHIVEYNNTEYIPDIYYPHKEGEYSSFADGRPLKKQNFSNMKEYYEFVKQYKDTPGFLYGSKSRVYKYIRDNFPNPIESNHSFHTWYIDIETRSVNGFASPTNPTEEISLIQIYDNYMKKFVVFGTRPFTGTFTSTYGDFVYKLCSNEEDMLTRFATFVNKADPTLIVGFNSDVFDIPYITNRMQCIGLDPTILSPIKKISSQEAYSYEKIKYTKYIWEGRMFLDYRDLYIKYVFMKKLPKYSLESIATEELGEGKVSYSEYDGLEHFYLEDYNKFVEYGTKDIELLVRLEEKLQLIETAKTIGYTCGVNCVDVFGTLVQWQELMYREAAKKKSILPLKQLYGFECPYPGGWVRSTPGKHKWIASFDFSSLYPSNIQFLNIGLDTLIKPKDLPEELIELKNKYFNWYNMENYDTIKGTNDNMQELYFIKRLIENKDEIHAVLEKYNVCVAPNGTFYRKDKKSLFASFMQKFYADRKQEKKQLKEAELELEKVEKELKRRKLTQ